MSIGERLEPSPLGVPFRNSLFFRAGVLALTLLCGFGLIQLFANIRLSRELEDAAEALHGWELAKQIGPEMETILRTAPVPSVRLIRYAADVGKYNSRIALYLLDSSGNVLLGLNPGRKLQRTGVATGPINEFLRRKRHEHTPVYGDDPTTEDRRALISVARIRPGDRDLFVYATLNAGSWDIVRGISEESALLERSALLLVLALACTVVIGIALASTFTRRFRSVAEQVALFGAGDYSVRMNVDTRDELGSLGTVLNRMAATIESTISELQNKDVLRRDLIANVSHDLRGPLGNIRAYVDELGREISGSSQFVNDALSTIEKNIAQLGRLLSDLFDLAKLEANEIRVSLHAIDLAALVTDAVASFKPAADRLHVRLISDLEPETPVARGDIVLLTRVLSNLIDNALKYTPSGGTVRVAATSNGNSIKVEVSDTGIGIPEEDLGRIFDRYYRPTQCTPRDGTGLGLAIVRHIIEAHGSKIEVSSSTNYGSAFAFSLSIFEAADAAQPVIPSNKSTIDEQVGK